MTRLRLEGSLVALVTPFDRSGGIDEEALRRLIRRQIREGTQGLVPCGSTGEAATLSSQEYRRVVMAAVLEASGTVPVIAGVGSNDTAKAAVLARDAEVLGADAILLLAPYYNKPTQEGIFRHFAAVSRATRLPIIAYNIPGRTAVNILPQTLERMARALPRLVGVKEASGSLDQVSEIRVLAPRLTILSGDDNLTWPMMAVGARGVISVAANVAPRQTRALCAAALSGDGARARSLHLRMFPLVKALFSETNPIPVKAALEMMGLCRGEPRLPLTPLAGALRPNLRAALREFGVL